MAEPIRQKVFKSIKEYLKNKPDGARYSEIIEFLKENFPDVPENTLHGSVWDFRQRIINGKEKADPIRPPESDIPRLESLCMRFGIGLILFDKDDLNNPKFQIRTRAMKSEPDYFYVNLYIQKLSKDDIKKLMG